ncbi:MaoC family dehydratase [Kitasatospora misakiensis]|uniref:MaoC family dehydratase n=1 Tax=Kitasatospora misakiensis TaxID=67330 RepID=A0ABW0X1P4_9ACTN
MRYAEDFTPGDTFDLGTVEVTAERLLAFAADFDPQAFHLDEALGHELGFGGLIASGWHTAAMFQRLYVDGLLSGAAVAASPGVDELRWLSPVRPGDVLRGTATVVGEPGLSLSRPDCSLLRHRCELTDAAGRPVFRMTLHVLFRKRPREEATA